MPYGIASAIPATKDRMLTDTAIDGKARTGIYRSAARSAAITDIIRTMSKKPTLDQKRTDHAALITGASSGIGRELAIAFSQTGHVILSGRNIERLEETRKLCKDPGNTTLACGDLKNTATLIQLSSLSDLYRLRYLICCASEYHKVAGDPDIDATERILTSNLLSTIKLIKLITPVLLRSGGGTVVHLNSVAGRNASPDEDDYSASKHGMSGFMKAHRFKYRERGIRCMDVFLGGMRSEMTRLRKDFDYLIDTHEAAHLIHTAATFAPTSLHSLQIEELSIGRFNFPPR